MTSTSASLPGTLYIVATPIGNRDDISARALKTLQSVDTILAEDTRHSRHFLTLCGIHKPLLSLHAYNEGAQSQIIITALLHGQSFALISDAGTPLISDPGYPLVKQAREQGVTVVPVPGACAVTTALSAAGIPCDTFTFYGFLPAKSSARIEKLQQMLHVAHTQVFYESTHRLMECLDDLEQVFGATCALVIAKEMTKHYERFISGSVHDVQHWFQEDPAHRKGEFVIMIPARASHASQDDAQHILRILLQEVPLKQAVKLAAQLTDIPKNILYDMALAWKAL